MLDIVQKWLDSNKVRDEYKSFIKKCSSSELEELFKEQPFVFGTAGYRTIISPGRVTYNDIVFEQLAIAYAKYIRSKHKDMSKPITVAIATDNRIDYKLNANIFKAVFNNYNIKTLHYKNDDPFPTPMLSYVIKNTDCVGGVNITASHNPKTYNGIKFYNEFGAQLLPNEDKVLISLIPNQEDVLTGKKYEIKNDYNSEIDEKLIAKYFDDIIKSLKLNKNTKFKEKILFSPMHGTAIPFMQPFLNSLGYDCISYEPHNFYDSSFSNAPCVNPELMNAFDDLIPFAEKNNIKYIFATDPDADRLGICYKKHGKWNLLNGNQTGILETYHLLKTKHTPNKQPVVVSTHVSNNLVDRILKKANGIVLRTATGFKNLAYDIRCLNKEEQNFISAFEEAIGALLTDINLDKDSFQVAGLLLEILSTYNDKNYDFFDILENVIFPEFGYWHGETFCQVIQGDNWKEQARSYLDLLSQYHYETILKRHINKIFYNEEGSCLEMHLENDSWIKFRISGTEPKFKIYFNLYAENSDCKPQFISKHLMVETLDILGFILQYLGISN